MAGKPFDAFRKGALVLAGLAVVASMAVSAPIQKDQQASMPLNANIHDQVAQRADLYANTEGMSGQVVMDESAGMGAMGVVSEDQDSQGYTTLDVGQVSIQYRVQSAHIDPAFPEVFADNLLKSGPEGISDAIHGSVLQVVNEGFMQENLQIMQSDPDGFAKNFKDKVQERVNQITHAAAPEPGHELIVVEGVDMTNLCATVMDAEHANRACVDGHYMASKSTRPGLGDLLKQRQEKIEQTKLTMEGWSQDHDNIAPVRITKPTGNTGRHGI